MSIDKTEALLQMITFDPNRDEAIGYLLSCPWEPGFEPVVASVSVLVGVLKQYVAGRISADDLEEWAIFIECRDDIEYSAIEDYVYALSNPSLMGEISQAKVAQMIDLLEET